VFRGAGTQPPTHEKVNVKRGAIALGHPLGCSGAALDEPLLNELDAPGVGLGHQTMCEAGGWPTAIIERPVADRGRTMRPVVASRVMSSGGTLAGSGSAIVAAVVLYCSVRRSWRNFNAEPPPDEPANRPSGATTGSVAFVCGRATRMYARRRARCRPASALPEPHGPHGARGDKGRPS